ncbi:GNAT family N-acetyltransferase [Xanthobacter autotrophicus]|uniref:GNAT family N-acetyltransferase n=1 Tax=Xanthobacter TaxID=279 RepID=UPI0024AB64A0|nr:GNAT family protein [Xanthobacter autotrophicus]MDI4664196.1 GNAT family N-acetyltransferase [Xanthobacter autotrophicus]
MVEPLPVIEGDGVYLRVPQMKDFGQWRDVREESRAFLTPWEPLWPADDLTRGAFRRRLRRYARDMVTDEAYPLFIFRSSDHALLGGLTLSNVRRGVCQAASLGYWMGAPYAGQGYMKAAVTALLPVAYDMLHLRRIEAACMPTNQPSIRLLESCGFVREGYSREYLCINGAWEDHILFGRLRNDMPARESARRGALHEVPPAAQ